MKYKFKIGDKVTILDGNDVFHLRYNRNCMPPYIGKHATIVSRRYNISGTETYRIDINTHTWCVDWLQGCGWGKIII